jgi:hypothetical protein
MEGISARQGPHQVAQKLRNTTLPLRSLVLRVVPSKRGRTKSAMGIGSRRSGTPAAVKAVPTRRGISPSWGLCGKRPAPATKTHRSKKKIFLITLLYYKKRKYIKGRQPGRGHINKIQGKMSRER